MTGVDTRIGEERDKMVLSLCLGSQVDGIAILWPRVQMEEQIVLGGDVFSFGHVGSEEPRIHPSVGPL